MSVDPSQLPGTRAEWRHPAPNNDKGIPPAEFIWKQLEPFFREQGYIFWVTSTVTAHYRKPPNDNERCPDPFAYRTDEVKGKPGFALTVSVLRCSIFYSGYLLSYQMGTRYPARTLDDRDVLIKLISKGNDGLNHLEALRRLAVGNVGSRGDNHTVPVLRLIVLQDMTFAVFPLMSEGFTTGWYDELHETIDAAIQLLEVNLCFVFSRRENEFSGRASHSPMIVWWRIG
jgi:hypothetical protein